MKTDGSLDIEDKATKERRSFSDRLYGRYMDRRNSVRSNRALDATWRGIILIVGLTVVGLGIFFLLFPGPGWAVIFFGLIVLATEYAWAQRMLNPVRQFSSQIARLFVSQEFRAKRSKVILIVTMSIVSIAYAYWAKWGATMQGFEPLLVPIENLFNIEI
jgi:uncharacterized protein (TIGR02611 family)